MKKSKIIILSILVVIVVLVLVVFLGYKISSNLIVEDDKKEQINEDNKSIEESEIFESKNDEISEKKYENVVLTSKIGNKVLSKFGVSNIYSKILYDAIDSNGIDDNTKLIYTYVTIVTKYDYHNMIKSSEKLGDYITKEDFEEVYKSLFGKESVIEHKSVITNDLYNEEEECYKFLTFGYGGIEFNFVIEIPYEIREYEDKVETYFYRLYGTSTSKLKEDGTQEQLVKLYNNNLKTEELYSSSDVKLQDNDSQNGYISDLIEKGEINKEKLEKITYTLIKEDDDYYIKSVIK